MTKEITKQKAGKPVWSHIMVHLSNALEAMVRVREYGNTKYSKIAADAGVPFDPESWRDNPTIDYLDSAQRHLTKVFRGERINHEDGGLEHIAQAMIDLAFAYEIEKQGGPRKQATSSAPAPVTITWDSIEIPLVDAPFAVAQRPVSGSYEATVEFVLSPQGFEALSKALERPQKPDTAKPPPPPLALRTLDVTDLPQNRVERSYLWADGGQHLQLVITSPEDLPPLVHMVATCSEVKRFGGHCRDAISITRHCVLVAKIARHLCAGEPDLDAIVRACLLHDIGEAMYGDIPTPRKHLERIMLPEGVEHPNDVLTRAFNNALEEFYEVNLGDVAIKQADNIAGYLEARARGVGNSELARWFDQATIAIAQRASIEALASGAQAFAWSPVDDTAQWYAMWRSAGGNHVGR